MEKNKNQKLSNTYKISFAVLFLVAGLFSTRHDFAQAAQSTCTAAIKFNPTYANGAVNLNGGVAWTNAGAGTCYDAGSNAVNSFYIQFFINGEMLVKKTGWNSLGSMATVVGIKKGNTNFLPFSQQFSTSEFYTGQSTQAKSAQNGQTLNIKACVDTSPGGYGEIRCSAVTPVVVGTAAKSALYGCQATTGVWTCSADQNDKNLQDACTAAGQAFGPVTPGDKCGCTNENYSDGSCKNGKDVTTSAPKGDSTTGGDKPQGDNTASNKLVDCTGPNADPNNCLYNPLPVNDLTSTLLIIMQGFLAIVGIWAVAFIVIGGFRMVISQGEEEALTAAKKTITWAVIGLALAMLSFSIVAIVQSLLRANVKDVSSKTGYRSEISDRYV